MVENGSVKGDGGGRDEEKVIAKGIERKDTGK